MCVRSCPTKDELVHFSTRDLPPRGAAKIQAHVSHCPACAAQLKEWDEALIAYRRYTPSVSEDLPQWRGFDDALRHEEDEWRCRRMSRSRRQWTAVATIAATLLTVAWFWQRTEISLNAEEVITRTVRQEKENPSSGPAIVWIRETLGALADAPPGVNPPRVEHVDTKRATAAEVVSSRGQVAQELATRLARYGFIWAAPLSARPFQRWRAMAERPQDSIRLMHPALIVVATTTAGAIRQVEMVVSQHTYQPLSQRWRFADGFEVELTSVKPNEPSLAGSPATVAESPEAVKSGAPPIDLEAVELDLRSTLHQLDAPVGTGLTIRQSRDGLRVEGKVETAATARHIAKHARRQRVVTTRIVVGSIAPDRGAPISPELREWLDHALRNVDFRENFVGRTWKLYDRLQLNIAALDELSRRYSDRRTATLSSDEQRRLADLAARQYMAVTAGYEALERQLAPLIGTISRPVMPAEPPADWRRAAAMVNEAIISFAADLGTVFGPAGADETPLAFEQRARGALRPGLEALAIAVSGEP